MKKILLIAFMAVCGCILYLRTDTPKSARTPSVAILMNAAPAATVQDRAPERVQVTYSLRSRLAPSTSTRSSK